MDSPACDISSKFSIKGKLICNAIGNNIHLRSLDSNHSLPYDRNYSSLSLGLVYSLSSKYFEAFNTCFYKSKTDNKTFQVLNYLECIYLEDIPTITII